MIFALLMLLFRLGLLGSDFSTLLIPGAFFSYYSYFNATTFASFFFFFSALISLPSFSSDSSLFLFVAAPLWVRCYYWSSSFSFMFFVSILIFSSIRSVLCCKIDWMALVDAMTYLKADCHMALDWSALTANMYIL